MFAGLTTCFSGLILIYFLQLSYAKHNYYCAPANCGNIRNISYPFRLKHDRKGCGDSNYELVCENNTAFLYLDSRKYKVESINYQKYTIRVADPCVNNSTCSFPRYSESKQIKFLQDHYPYNVRSFDNETLLAWPVTFLSCQYPQNYSFYLKADHCVERYNNSRYVYMKVGHLNASDVGYECRIDLVLLMSTPFKDHSNLSLLELHKSLVYGFEISWFGVYCGEGCRGNDYCRWDTKKVVCENMIFWDSCILHDTPGCGGIQYKIARVTLELLANSLFLAILFTITIFAIKIVIGWPFLLGLLIYKLRRRYMSMFDVIEGFLQSYNNLIPIRYSYSDIKKVTRGFQEKLGQGGYGSVYKGKLRSGHYVAVKVLSAKSKPNGQDFMNEVATTGRIHHVNVVKLVGYCAEGSKRALIYDFMPNGSLDKYIFKQETNDSLNWGKKYEIAVGVARGIEYLHRGCEMQILHFDIKPHNILLDENFIPKISDFGLAKFYSTEKNTVTLTAARGTIGYVAPELINRSIGNVSYKADVYSFGMLLMEMVGLKRDLARNDENSSHYFPYWIYNHLDIEVGSVSRIDDVDDKLAKKMTIVALWCIQMSPDKRPSMSRVMEMFESEVESLRIPPYPTHSSHEMVAQTWETESNDSISLLRNDNSTDQ